MSYNVFFISLGCAKNQVNCEQMMATVQHAGHNIVLSPEGADVAVVNTCGFLASACEEAIDNILEMAELKQEGRLKKIIVTGCMAQRYKDDVLRELPEVDAVLGTGSYGDIAFALDEVMSGAAPRPCHMGDIHHCAQGGARILSTPPWYAYLRIAEGCDNCCAYCVIPRLRGRYRSRPMAELLDEASELASAGVKELIVIAQDITRYGTDLNGEHQLAALLRELCKLDFHWIRLHYLYPDDITDELVDTIAQEKKIVPYLDIPIQHCNDGILKAMNRRDTKESLRKVPRPARARARPGAAHVHHRGTSRRRRGGIRGALRLFARGEDRARGRVPVLARGGDEGRDDGTRSRRGSPAPHGAFDRRAERDHRRVQRLRPRGHPRGAVRGLERGIAVLCRPQLRRVRGY